MKPPRFSLRTLLIFLTVASAALAVFVWADRETSLVSIADATPELANKVLRGFVTVPETAAGVSVEYQPSMYASLRFDIDEGDARIWCLENNWTVTDIYDGEGFDFVVPGGAVPGSDVPNGDGQWFGGEVRMVVFSPVKTSLPWFLRCSAFSLHGLFWLIRFSFTGQR